MWKLIASRVLQMPVIVLAIYTITLGLAWAVPGNPLDREGRRPPAAVEEAMKRQYNLDSFWTFYWTYLRNASGVGWVLGEGEGTGGEGTKGQRDRGTEGGRHEGTEARRHEGTEGEGTQGQRDREGRDRGTEGQRDKGVEGEEQQRGMVPGQQRDAITGAQGVGRPVFDLGPSLEHEEWTVNEIIGDSLPVSAALGLSAIVLATFLGVGAGVVGAIRPNSWMDLATLSVALVGISVPSFVVGTVLLMVFSVWLRWAPVAEFDSVGDVILPAVTLSLPFGAYIARLTRMGLIEALGAEYVRTARAKGVKEGVVVLKHALRNALLPVVSYLGPATAYAMTGSFVVEKVFSVPGLGEHFVDAVLNKDLFLIIGVVLVFSTLLLVLNLAVDVLYRWVDPRTG